MSCPEPSGDAVVHRPAATAGDHTAVRTAGRARRPAHRPAVPLIYAITLTGILANPLIGPAVPDILDHFGQPTHRAGQFVAAITLPGIVMAPAMGVLADRFGRRNVLIPCLASFGLFGLAAAVAPTFEVLVVCRFLQGIGSAGLINLAVVLIGDHWDGAERARLIGRNAAVLTVSLAVLPPLGGGLTELGGWRLTFVPFGVAFATALAVWRGLDGSRPAHPGSLRSQLRDAGAALRQLVVIASIFVGFVVFLLIFGLFLTTLPVHLEEEFGLSAGARGLIIAAPALTASVVALNLGRIRLHTGAGRLLIVAPGLFAVGFLFIGTTETVTLLVAGGLIYGLGEGLFIPVVQDVVVGAATAETRGALTAVWVGAARAGQTVGPLLAGATYGATSTGTTFVLGAVVAAGLIVIEAAVRLGPRADATLALADAPA